MLKGFNLVCRLIAVEWQQQLYESSVKIEQTVASGYRTKYTSITDTSELS